MVHFGVKLERNRVSFPLRWFQVLIRKIHHHLKNSVSWGVLLTFVKAQLNRFYVLSYYSHRKVFPQEYLSTHSCDKTDKVTVSLSVLLAGQGQQLGNYIHFHVTNYLQKAVSRIKCERKECK